MFVLRLTIRRCALVAAALFVAAECRASAPPALPDWPDQSPSVYSAPRTVPTDAVQKREPEPVVPAAFVAPPTATPIKPLAAPAASDVRRLTAKDDRHLSSPTKRDRTAASSPQFPSFGLPINSIYTTVTALSVVLGLFLLAVGLARRSGKRSNGRLPEEVVSVLGRVPLAPRQFAELIRLGNKLVLVALTPGGAEPLAEIIDPAEIDRIVGLCQQTSKKSSTAEFDQIFRQLADETAPAGFLGNEVPRIDLRSASGSDVFAAYRGGVARA